MLLLRTDVNLRPRSAGKHLKEHHMYVSEREAERVAEVMSGLATPSRVIIMARLLEGPTTVSDLASELNLGQTAVSNHLRVLRLLNLVVGDRKGRNIYYSLRDHHVQTIVEHVLEHTQHE